MARVPTRLSGPTQLTNSPVTQLTVAASELNVIRHLHVQNPSGAPVNLTVSIGTDAANKRIYDAYPIAANSAVDLFGYYPLVAAEILQASGSTTGVLVLTVNGDRVILG